MDSPTTRTSLPSRPAPAATGLSSPCRVPNRASVDALQPRKTPSSAVDSGRQNGGKSPARSRQKTVTTAPRELASPAAGRAEGTGSIRQSESRRGRNASLEASVSSGVSVRPASGSNPARHSSEDAGSSKRSYLRKAASGIASAPREVCTLATVAQKSPSQSARTSGSHVQAADARKRVLVAGATGYVGSAMVKELASRLYSVRSLCRVTSKTENLIGLSEIVHGDITDPQSLKGHLHGVDTVISCIGTNSMFSDPRRVLRDGTINLFHEAALAGVSHFIVVTELAGPDTREILPHMRAKEQAVDFIVKESQALGMTWSIVRPTLYVKELDEMFIRTMKEGKFQMIGDGSVMMNPISNTDLAERICECLISEQDWNTSISVGGPETLSIKEIGQTIFSVLGTEPQFESLHPWIIAATSSCMSTFRCCYPVIARYGDSMKAVEWICTHNSIGASCGSQKLRAHFAGLASELRREELAANKAVPAQNVPEV